VLLKLLKLNELLLRLVGPIKFLSGLVLTEILVHGSLRILIEFCFDLLMVPGPFNFGIF
jgi:hypothetical protein